MSFVLAMVLSVGLGSAVFGSYSYSSYVDSFNEEHNGNTYTVNINDAHDVLGGNLTAVFGYYAGSIVDIKGADGSFTLYDSYGPRFSASNKGDIWQVTGVELRTSDLAEMEKYDSAEAFFATMGFDVSMVDMNDTDSNGQPKGTGTSITKEWWSAVKNALSKGANHSVSISAGTSVTGPMATISENGKRMQTIQSNADSNSGIKTIAQYYYDSNGFMTGYAENASEAVKSEDGTTTYKDRMNYTAITYNKNGVMTETTYKLFDWTNNPSATVNAGLKSGEIQKAGAQKTGSVGEITSVTKYSANNSRLLSIDYSTNNTTYFAGGQPSYVQNESGVTIGLYSYTKNGIMTAYFNAEGLDGNGNKVGSTTLCDKWGRQVGTVLGGLNDGKNPFKNASQRKKDLAEMNNILSGNSATAAQYTYNSTTGRYEAKEGTGTRVQSINIYPDQILNDSVRTQNGFIDMKYVRNEIKKGHLNNILKNNLSGFGYTTKDLKNMLLYAQGGSSPIASTQIQHSTWDGDNIPGKDGVTGSSDYSQATTSSKTQKSKSSFGSHTYGSLYKTDTKTTAAGITYNNTIYFGGAQAYQTKHCVVTQVYESTTQWYEQDPAVRGTYQGTVDINGKTYVKVSASEVNIMDGNGFQAADGETVLVDIDSLDEDTKNQIMNMKEGDEIMFMGDVRQSADGKSFTMAVNTEYSGGVAMGDNISKMREAIQNESLDWVKQNTAINSALIGDQNIGGDWKSGWNILVNGGKKDPKDHIPADDMPVLF